MNYLRATTPLAPDLWNEQGFAGRLDDYSRVLNVTIFGGDVEDNVARMNLVSVHPFVAIVGYYLANRVCLPYGGPARSKDEAVAVVDGYCSSAEDRMGMATPMILELSFVPERRLEGLTVRYFPTFASLNHNFRRANLTRDHDPVPSARPAPCPKYPT